MKSIFGFIIGILLCLGLAAVAGESPIHVLHVLFNSAFGTAYDFGLTLFYSTSLVFTGLSVCIAFHSGLFNIGAEGQLIMGALGATAYGLLFPNTPKFLAPWMAGIAALLCGAVWGFLPGYLKARRGSHEVVVTMMMNFIAAGISSYFILGIFRSQESQNPESQILDNKFLFKDFDFVSKAFGESPVNISLFIAILLCIAVFIFLEKSKAGFELRTAGTNETVAQFSGINPEKIKILGMTLAGAIAGFVAFNEIMGSSGKFRIGFSPEYGFIGIAVALLAHNKPLLILPSALLFGALQKGATDLDIETTHITRDFARILQAVIIFSVVAMQVFPRNLLGRYFKLSAKKEMLK